MEDEEVGLGIVAQRLVGLVGVGKKSDVFIALLLIVGDEQREIHGIVGDEFGGGGTQHVQLTFRPFKLPDIEREFRILEFGILTNHIVGQVFVHLGIMEGGFPHITHIKLNISEVGLEVCPLFKVAGGVGNRLIQNFFRFFGLVDIEG